MNKAAPVEIPWTTASSKSGQLKTLSACSPHRTRARFARWVSQGRAHAVSRTRSAPRPALDPIAVRAGVVDGSWLPRTARAMAHLASQVTSREAEATGHELMRLPHARRRRTRWTRGGRRIPQPSRAGRAQAELPPGVASVSVSVDRVTVPMEAPIPRAREAEEPPQMPSEEAIRKCGHEVTPRTWAVRQEAKRVARAPQPKIQRNYRMACCATVTLHDAHGDALHTIHYGRMSAAVDSAEQYTQREVHRMMHALARIREVGKMPRQTAFAATAAGDFRPAAASRPRSLSCSSSET